MKMYNGDDDDDGHTFIYSVQMNEIHPGVCCVTPGLLQCIAYACSIGGMGTLTGIGVS